MSAEAVNNFGSASVPDKVSLHILAGLNAESLAVVNLVCKHWSQLTKKEDLLAQLDLKILFKRVSFIDEPVWETHVSLAKFGLSFVGNVKNQCNTIRELQRCLSWPIEKINRIRPGITLVDIPKGLSINKLQAMAPKLFKWVNPYIIEKYGDIEVERAYTIIISDEVMDETRMKDSQQQLVVIEKHEGKRPKAIEELALLVLTFLNSGKKLCSTKVVTNGQDRREVYTFTRCEEKVMIKDDPNEKRRNDVGASYQVVVGFQSEGVYLTWLTKDSNEIGLSAKHQFSK